MDVTTTPHYDICDNHRHPAGEHCESAPTTVAGVTTYQSAGPDGRLAYLAATGAFTPSALRALIEHLQGLYHSLVQPLR